ncbi:hypothetical protein F5884DRAFT_118395 [Xylogone sp. PMI_703]|nr:hypothetical protein F5884DRAFT_118395 [Xylogone sp. PMI_703]
MENKTEPPNFPFTLLPPEIRRMIWYVAASVPKTVRVQYDVSTGMISSDRPPLFYACKESRQCLVEMHRKPLANMILFNPASDSLNIIHIMGRITTGMRSACTPTNQIIYGINDFLDVLIPIEKSKERKMITSIAGWDSYGRIRHLEVDHLVFLWLLSDIRRHLFCFVDQLKINLIDSSGLCFDGVREVWIFQAIHGMWRRSLLLLRSYFPTWQPPTVIWSGQRGERRDFCSNYCCEGANGGI